MGTEQKKIMISWFLAFIVMATASLWDALEVCWAALRHPPVNPSALNLVEPARTEFRRQEQQYFLDFGVYIPLDDIMYVDQLASGGQRYAKALDRHCSGLKPGRGFAIWLPIKIKIPLIGERVSEWCWRPNIRS